MDQEDRIRELKAKTEALEHTLAYLMAELIIKNDALTGASEARGDVQELMGKMLQSKSTRPVGLELQSFENYVENILDSTRMSR